MNFSFRVERKDSKTRARVGLIKTPHGEIQTPAFSPVATRASVRALDVPDLEAVKTQVILANTYHLYLRPGVETIEKFGGFGSFMGWRGPTMTDSGGYQVSFLWKMSKETDEEMGRVIKITNEGTLFASHLDGSRHLLTPEKSMEIQKALGADIIMALDQPLGMNYSERQKKEAFRRTLLWEERSFIAWRKQNPPAGGQALFGIIQGDEGEDLRRKSLNFLLGFDFPGLAIGGESIGADPAITAQTLDVVADLLPEDKPLHALGLGGGPEGIFEAVQRGVDLFDNSSVTRLARNGWLFVYPQDGGTPENKFRFDFLKKKFKDEKKPVSRVCHCYTCQKYSRAYLHHLLVSKELLGFRLATIHNVFFINNLMSKIREAIGGGDFVSLKKEWLGD